MKTEEDNFMKAFKYYKMIKQQPSIKNVLYVENNISNQIRELPLPSYEKNDNRHSILGLKPLGKWRTYNFKNHPGLVLIRNPFTNLGQRYWIRKCLEEYPRSPNKKNIDIEMRLDDWWRACHASKEIQSKQMKKLRWTTLGYHHNWDTKLYNDDHRTPFPEDLAELSDVVANYLGFTSFRAEAAIVNYYYMKSTLSAHTDHSEVNLEAPLLSFSFGQSAIFLIGGPTKTTAPSAVLLQSGDVMVMSKEARLCYHAVPKIIPCNNATWNEELSTVTECLPNMKYVCDSQKLQARLNLNIDNKEWSDFNNYIKESRINVNVRQVLNENQTSLSSALIT
ncbi:hypothetical protein ACJJTC_002165 [Scirpophaga incertulas]